MRIPPEENVPRIPRRALYWNEPRSFLGSSVCTDVTVPPPSPNSLQGPGSLADSLRNCTPVASRVKLPGASDPVALQDADAIVSLVFFKATHNKNMETGNGKGPCEQPSCITAANEGDCREVDGPPFLYVLFLACVFQSK